MSRAWAQFRDLGIPRCKWLCNRLIFPWQDWVCEIEEWPIHHACHHLRTEQMLAFTTKQEADEPESRYHWDGYDACRYCGRRTPAIPYVEEWPWP